MAETDGEAAGVVTSGTQSPTLGKALAMAYLPSDMAVVGREVFVQIRNRSVRARVADLPFYSRKKKQP
jgi:aminomethyltransferase